MLRKFPGIFDIFALSYVRKNVGLAYEYIITGNVSLTLQRNAQHSCERCDIHTTHTIQQECVNVRFLYVFYTIRYDTIRIYVFCLFTHASNVQRLTAKIAHGMYWIAQLL